MKLLAALTFFTRMPFWKIKDIPANYFKDVIVYWPLVGWLTGGVTAAVLWIASLVLPLPVAVALALICRLLLTGGLHEDGLADFFDGFGGGTTREKTLAIMKDSAIGSYGVITLILYFLLLWILLSALPVPLVFFIVLSGDVYSKCIAAQISNVLPYARKEEESKTKITYNRMGIMSFLFACITGMIPLFVLLPPRLWLAGLFPLLVFGILYKIMKRKIQGYTGDCCGAAFLLCELSFYLGAVLIVENTEAITGFLR